MPENEPHHDCNLDNLLVKTSQNIEKYGLQVISVFGTDYLPSFSYSIGLRQTYGQPEIICFGLNTKLMHALINDVAALIKQGMLIEPGKRYAEIFKGTDATFLRVEPDNIDDYFGVAIEYYKNDQFPAVQLVWPDDANRFPWEEGFAQSLTNKQPLLDRNVTFKFWEANNLGVFTTRQWLDLRQPILRVVHDHDGEWQFLTGDQLFEDIRIVGLEQLVKRDPTLNKVFDLDYGEAADRTAVGEKWTRSKVEEDEGDEDEEEDSEIG
jgi:hypothetical protein